VAGYLVTEVLDRHSPELLDFLRKISTVDVVSAELANALTGRHDSARLLADLAASHLFVQAVGRPGRWYRLHRLLADILRAQPTTRRERRDLHRRATEWFRDHDRPLEAISSAIAGQLWPLAAEIVGVHLVALAHQGHARALERMLLAVPAVTLRAYPELTAGLAGARIIQGNRAGVTDLLTAARAATGRVQVRHPARARLLVNLAASGLARLDGNWEAAAAAHRAVPTDPAVVAGLGIAAPTSCRSACTTPSAPRRCGRASWPTPTDICGPPCRPSWPRPRSPSSTRPPTGRCCSPNGASWTPRRRRPTR